MFLLCLLFLLCPLTSRAELAPPPTTPVIDLFVSGISNFSWSKGLQTCYRIPSIIRTTSGTLLAFAAERIGPHKECNDEFPANIVQRRSRDFGLTWEPATLVLAKGNVHSPRSPWAIFDSKRNQTLLFTNKNAAGCHCDVMYLTSADDGETWQVAPNTIPEKSGYYGSSLAHGITLRSGRLIGCMRRLCYDGCRAPYQSRAYFSDDGGSNWATSDWLAEGTTECQLAELANGHLYMSIRPLDWTWKGKRNLRVASWSTDGGATWSPATPVPELIDYGSACEGSVISDPDNNAVYYVHADSRGRSNLTLWKSQGDATSWTIVANVYPHDAYYSDSVVLDPRTSGGRAKHVGVLFERDRPIKISYRAMGVE